MRLQSSMQAGTLAASVAQPVIVLARVHSVLQSSGAGGGAVVAEATVGEGWGFCAVVAGAGVPQAVPIAARTRASAGRWPFIAREITTGIGRREDRTRARRCYDFRVADEDIDLPEATRSAIAAVWRSRAAAEAGVERYVRDLGEDLRAIGADASVLALVDRALADESRHAAECLAIAARYAGAEVIAPPSRAFVDPLADVPMPLRATLRAVGMSCISESIASVWIDDSARRARPRFLHASLRAHLGDEVHHARLGWAHLASRRIDGETRRALDRWVEPLLRATLPSWLEFDPCWPVEGFPEHGLPSHDESRRSVQQAVFGVVLPGLEHLGIDVRAARAWSEKARELREGAARGEDG
jgi:hypothetical protein